MSSDDTQNAPVPSDRREAVREKAQLVQAKQSRARKIRVASVATAVVAVVAVAGMVVSWAVGSAASKPMLDPANVTSDGVIVTSISGVSPDDEQGEMAEADAGSSSATAAPVDSATPDPSATADAAVDIRVYVDYLSPGSQDFQAANAPQLSSWVTEGAASLTYYPVAMLTSKSSGTRYSLRAASAAACVANHSPETFFTFTTTLLAAQPDLDSAGFTDSELADMAQASGAASPKVLRACIEEEDFALWAKAATDRALKEIPDTDGVALTGTPMVLVNGIPYAGALDDPAEFSQFVLTIASDSYYKTASPTPSPTP